MVVIHFQRMGRRGQGWRRSRCSYYRYRYCHFSYSYWSNSDLVDVQEKEWISWEKVWRCSCRYWSCKRRWPAKYSSCVWKRTRTSSYRLRTNCSRLRTGWGQRNKSWDRRTTVSRTRLGSVITRCRASRGNLKSKLTCRQNEERSQQDPCSQAGRTCTS